MFCAGLFARPGNEPLRELLQLADGHGPASMAYGTGSTWDREADAGILSVSVVCRDLLKLRRLERRLIAFLEPEAAAARFDGDGEEPSLLEEPETETPKPETETPKPETTP